jgi:hypothetical protein
MDIAPKDNARPIGQQGLDRAGANQGAGQRLRAGAGACGGRLSTPSLDDDENGQATDQATYPEIPFVSNYAFWIMTAAYVIDISSTTSSKK